MDKSLERQLYENTDYMRKMQKQLEQAAKVSDDFHRMGSYAKSVIEAAKPDLRLVQLMNQTNNGFPKQLRHVVSLGEALKPSAEMFTGLAQSMDQSLASLQRMERITGLGLPMEKIFQQQEAIGQLFKTGVDLGAFQSITQGLRPADWHMNVPLQKIDWSESFTALEGLTKDLEIKENEESSIGNADLSVEEIEAISENITDVMAGDQSASNFLEFIKARGKYVRILVLQDLLLNIFWAIVMTLMTLANEEFDTNRHTVARIQEVLIAEIRPLKAIHLLMKEEEITISQPIGLSRTEQSLRQGPSKTAPVVPNAIMKPQTVVFVLTTNPSDFERKHPYKPKKNWRRIGVDLNGTYVEGWVPESAVQRIQSPPLRD